MQDLKAFVINLDSRADRWSHVLDVTRRLGLEVERFPAVVDSPGWKGCLRSHLACIERADRLGLQDILIMEDDVLINEPMFHYFVAEIVPYLRANRELWHRFSGGPTMGSGEFDPDLSLVGMKPRLFQANGFCTQFDFINRNAFAQLINELTMVSEPIDVRYIKLGKSGHIVNACTYPHVATQENFTSDVTRIDGNLELYFSYSNQCLRNCLSDNIHNAECSTFRDWPARHKHWTGTLRLFVSNDIAVHVEAGSLGTYTVSEDVVTVTWFDFGSEKFRKSGDNLQLI